MADDFHFMVAAFKWVLYGSHFAAADKNGLKVDLENDTSDLKIDGVRKERKHTMKVMAFNGSARKDGNTAILINYVLKKLQS